jgi:hypothetical protein
LVAQVAAACHAFSTPEVWIICNTDNNTHFTPTKPNHRQWVWSDGRGLACFVTLAATLKTSAYSKGQVQSDSDTEESENE